MDDKILWQTKLDARLHDPGEKALILMRTREGHEGGTVKALRERLALDAVERSAVKRADWWASAADRPQWPRSLDDRLHWTTQPVLIHPVSGEEIDLAAQGRLKETEPDDIAARSLAHFERLRQICGNDPRKTLLAFWRFGTELDETDDSGKLGALWQQLPADTRVPDHSIWEHLDLASGFAGAFAADQNGEAALLAMSIGPVQPFIAAARSTSDLWAGSHLLARLAWETMKPLVGALGPDAVLFPRLRGIPQVDLWLKDECGLPEELFAGAPWQQGASADANPLFAAALPNRFVALVPADQARELAARCREGVRGWTQRTGKRVVERLLEEAGIDRDESLYCFEQARRQLDGFPEVHWATVPFSLIRASEDGNRIVDTVQLSESMAPFFGVESTEPAGFLASEAWRVLQRDIEWDDGTRFYIPNPGVLYPAVFDLAERLQAAAKMVREFGQVTEEGWRDSLTGEAEWLTTDKARLAKSFRQQTDTLWAKIAEKRPSWAKKGEHLGALSAIKRLWPTLFTEEAGAALGRNLGRFVVSTHTMALAHQMDDWLERGGLTSERFTEASASLKRERVALSPRLLLRHRDNPALADARALLALMEQAQEYEEEDQGERLREVVRETLQRGNDGEGRGTFRMETYYGLIMMDGDNMGALLAGDHGGTTYRDSFHPVIRRQFDARAEKNPLLRRYGETRRAASPGRHMAISGALNDFALHVVPHIVHREYLGRLIYSGGDDVLAMLPVAELLPAAVRLRDAWSGKVRFARADEQDSQRRRLELDTGHALLDGRLLRMMGAKATASAGLVVAHHQTPLARVLRELREAEKCAKGEGGRDALHIRVLKRSGGALRLTLKWEQLAVFQRLLAFLREPGVSRRAVYHCLQWIHDLPEPRGDGEMLARLLGYQLCRQAGAGAVANEHGVKALAGEIVSLAVHQEQPIDWTGNFLSVAEFLARETRTPGNVAQDRKLHGETA